MCTCRAAACLRVVSCFLVFPLFFLAAFCVGPLVVAAVVAVVQSSEGVVVRQPRACLRPCGGDVCSNLHAFPFAFAFVAPCSCVDAVPCRAGGKGVHASMSWAPPA